MLNKLPIQPSKLLGAQSVISKLTSSGINSGNVDPLLNLWNSFSTAKLNPSQFDSTSLTQMKQFKDIANMNGLPDALALQSALTNAKNQENLNAAKAPEVAAWKSDSDALQASNLKGLDLQNIKERIDLLDKAGLSTPTDVSGAVSLLEVAMFLIPGAPDLSVVTDTLGNVTGALDNVPGVDAVTSAAGNVPVVGDLVGGLTGSHGTGAANVPGTPDLSAVTGAAGNVPIVGDLVGGLTGGQGAAAPTVPGLDAVTGATAGLPVVGGLTGGHAAGGLAGIVKAPSGLAGLGASNDEAHDAANLVEPTNHAPVDAQHVF